MNRLNTGLERIRRLLPAALVVTGSLLAGCAGEDVRSMDSDAEYANWLPDAVYVGRDACRDCHPDKYESFVRSQMGRSWKPALRSLSDADFDDPPPVYAVDQDLFYQPFSRGEELFVREYRIADGDTVHTRVEQIDFIVGSGQHTNSHIYSENGYLYQIPVTWYAQDGRWDMAPGFRELNGRFSRPIPEECMTCHNGRSPVVPGSENRFESVAAGIGCERCHGPGSKHIEAIRAGRAVDVSREIDFTIVNPGKLSPEREMDLCRRCHMQGVDVFRRGVRPDDFRPGRALSDFEHVFWPRQPDSIDVFNMASHPDRLGMSRCFEATWEKGAIGDPMTCTTCHDPHVPIEARGPDFYASVCLSCHESRDVSACTFPGVAEGPAVQDCASCHMPVSGTDDIPHVRITDHFIRVADSSSAVSEPDRADPKRVIRMASLTGGAATAADVASGFLGYYEKITNRPEMLALADSALKAARATLPAEALVVPTIQLWYLKEDFTSIRRFVRQNPDSVPDDAWTHFRIGSAFYEAGELAFAAGYFERAVALAPQHLRFMDRLGVTYTRQGDYERAIAVFDQVLTANPKFEPSVNNRGFAHLAASRFSEAEIDFLAAVALDPDAEIALANLASLYVNTERAEEAIPLVRRLMKLAPENQDYRRLWSVIAP